MQEYFTAFFITELPTDKKHKAYKNLSNVLEESSADYSFNFWSLCYEMDKTVFLSNFLVPQLKKIYRQLEGKKERELLDAYFEIIQPVILKGNFGQKENAKYRIFRRSNFQNAILDFSEAYNFDEVWKFPEMKDCQDELHDIYIKQKEEATEDNGSDKNIPVKRSLDVVQNKEVIEFLIKHGILEVVSTIEEKIHKKILEWDLLIKRKKSNIDDLLGS